MTKRPPTTGAHGGTGKRPPDWLGPVLGLLAAAITALVLRPGLVLDRPDPDADRPPATDTLAVTPSPDAPAAPAATEGPTRDAPFRGTPAADWADGRDGLDAPPPGPVGGVSAARMDEAVRLIHAFLAGTNLAPGVLAGETPHEALALVDPASDAAAWLELALAAPGPDHDPTALLSRFHPDRVGTLGDVVKVAGRTEAEPAPDGGAIIHTDHTFVYALRAADGSERATRAVVRRVIDFAVHAAPRPDGHAATVWPLQWQVYRGNDDCAVTDGYLNPRFGPDAAADTAPPTDPYDREGVPPAGEECSALARL
ncbi:hypothetical protein [Streptomyces sp. RFCAC02]|uniref:hypothetical protein n=1 Tax=Streptomyces sp. RFCAC02 TaxID=2499143 RepID=UPI0010206B25|nr:hypothetical protein [Streptomyces sp. RFCAC02]